MGGLAERFKYPSVVGEIIAGILLGPHLLGSHIVIPKVGPLFAAPAGGALPVDETLWAVSQLGIILLLFLAGVETDPSLFFKYGAKGAVIAVGGVILPFILGDWVTVAFGYAKGFMSPLALFMGATLTATSVGVTVRILTDYGKVNTPEGVSIIAAAVIDDVMGMVVLAMVSAFAVATIREGKHISPGAFVLMGAKGIGVWILLLAIGLGVAPSLLRFLARVGLGAHRALIVFAVCLLVSSAVEYFGLAMIVGAYAVGMAFSRTVSKREIVETLRGASQLLTPLFFASVGMLVDIRKAFASVWYGIAVLALAILGKVVGCGGAALATGFDMKSAAKIGFGMMPRGEIALVIVAHSAVAIHKLAQAGVGVPEAALSATAGAAVLVVLGTSIISPLILSRLFRDAEAKNANGKIISKTETRRKGGK